MRCQKRVVLTSLSARVELDEKDESYEALIFWWGRQICPHPGRVGRKGGGSAPLQRACAFGNLVQGTVRVPAEYGTWRCADEIFREGIIV